MNTGDKITSLKKVNMLSQGNLVKIAGVSREIIGRYERGEASPSIEVARKIAEGLEPSIKDKLLFLANAIIRDAKTGKAYAQ
ncbi:helix-turn-helix transcriptional regulator [Sphingobacterium endophyticum]|uniref:helix-turn-helix transcriptional regulator n=1 Tax=Sphingobacterium endophyticum TaxID=2546448 RepID=UPI0012E30377|nr:helix-turn-helix domain-containing protein [Sphingobacterium endophyticum]